jgi:Mg2+-importing ATPase
MAIDSSTRPWWLESFPDAAKASAYVTTGLSSAEARLRLAKFGPNLFSDHQELPLWRQFLARFKNPLVLLLLAASAISAMTGN